MAEKKFLVFVTKEDIEKLRRVFLDVECIGKDDPDAVVIAECFYIPDGYSTPEVDLRKDVTVTEVKEC